VPGITVQMMPPLVYENRIDYGSDGAISGLCSCRLISIR
jgi:hypothetical protein